LPAAQATLRRQFESADSAEACVRASSLVVVMTPWPEFHAIPAGAFARTGGRLAVVDCWRTIPADVAAVADLVYLGVGASQDQSTPA
jgi:hypothetical protein